MTDAIRKCQLVRENVFTVKVGTIEFKGLRQASEWEGFRKLVDDEGNVLILAPDRPGTPFEGFFRALEGKNDSAFIIMASPRLLDELVAREAKTTPSPEVA